LADSYGLDPATLARLALEAFAEMASSEDQLRLPIMLTQVE
jgi:hypothetical protein